MYQEDTNQNCILLLNDFFIQLSQNIVLANDMMYIFLKMYFAELSEVSVLVILFLHYTYFFIFIYQYTIYFKT